MEGDKRREAILVLLRGSNKPVSGTFLAGEFGVSRQIIVQDIALIRAINKNVLATNKGYVLFRDNIEEEMVKRSLKVRHKEEEILDELFTIVDLGGKVLDVVVEHPIYGQIMVDLVINSRADAEHFMKQVRESKTKPLNELTDGIHYHTVKAENEEILLLIEKKLKQKGYLIS